MLRKRPYLFAFIFVFSLFIFFTPSLYHAWQSYQDSRYLVHRRKELSNKQTSISKYKIGTTVVTTLFPEDTSNKIIPIAEKKMTDFVRVQIGKSKPRRATKNFFFIYVKKKNTGLKNASLFQIKFVKDTKLKSSVRKGRVKSAQFFYATSGGKLLTFADIFKNLDQAKQILLEKIVTQLRNKGLSEYELQQASIDFENVNLSDLEFTYDNSRLTINFPNNNLSLSGLTIPIEQLFDVINPDYLSDSDCTAYRQILELQKHAVKKNDTEKLVALTFDDGPNVSTTPQLLDTLEKYKVKATFFIVGKNIIGNENILKRELADGHEIANHSWSHPDLLGLPISDAIREIKKTQSAIKEATGYTPRMFRPPYGNVSQSILDSVDIPAIYWSVDSEDWKSHDESSILQKVQSEVYPGAIVLMHDIHATTVSSLPQVIEYLKSQGYHFVTVEEMYGSQLKKGFVYYSQNSCRRAEQ